MTASICTAVITRRAEKIDRHTARQPPAQYRAPRTRPHVASGSLLSRKKTKQYSARCLQIRRDGKALHKICNAVDLKVVEHWVP